MMYRENLMDHYRNPRNKGALETYDVRIKEYNPLCGDEMEWTVKIEEGKVQEAKFQAKGCAISIASASMLSTEIEGMSTEEIIRMENEEIYDMVGVELSPMRIKCALLGLKTLQKGLLRG